MAKKKQTKVILTEPVDNNVQVEQEQLENDPNLELRARVVDLEQNYVELNETVQHVLTTLEEMNQFLRDSKIVHRNRNTNQEEPYINIFSKGLDESGNLLIEMDWNDAFILMLEASGYDGASEREKVMKWLGTFSKVVEGVPVNFGE
jgi:hypothetical protein